MAEEVNNFRRQLQELKDTRTFLDKTIFSQSSVFLGAILGFFKEVLVHVEKDERLRWTVLTIVFLLVLSIVFNICSQTQSIKESKKILEKQISVVEVPQMDKDLNKYNFNYVSILNLLHQGTFIGSLVFILVSVTFILKIF